LGDGRGANKPWLQELPDPVTKTMWQTVAELHPTTAARLGVDNGDLVKVATSAGSLTIPAYLYLGIRPDTVAVAAGRGQTRAGRYAKAGENAYTLLPFAEDASGAFAQVSTKATVTKAGGHLDIVTTEGSARQHGREVAQAMTIAELLGHTHGDHEEHEMPGDASHEFLPGLRSPVANDAQGVLGDPKSKDKGQYDPEHWGNQAKRRWAMTIDLARCTGCSACVTACYAENNIPTVGADWQAPSVMPDRSGFGANILRSREMSWLRLERYYEGGEDGSPNFETRFLPMLCQHCGNAPCEPVCPVYATYH
jgi:molybdopterin-containing oxidoreductase family iron-sulfur binding subunit